MSLTSQVGSSDVAFKLTQKIVSALADKFAFKFEDGWDIISSRSIEYIQKRLKREKRRANPTSAIKHSRTAFSYFTRGQRPIEQAAHPEATFGQLSRYVSEAWKKLTPEQMTEFKAMETVDKVRYQDERAAMLASAPAPVVSESVADSSSTETPVVKEKKAKATKATKAVSPTIDVAPVAPKTEKVKSAKTVKPVAVVEAVAAPVAAVAAPVAAPVVAEAKPTKAKSAKKEVEAVVEKVEKVEKVVKVEKVEKVVKVEKAAAVVAVVAVAPVVKTVSAPKVKAVKA